MSDTSHVVQRSYYREDSGVEAHRVIDAWQLTFNLGCVLKYLCRAGNKDGATIAGDLNKALTYIDFEVDFYDRIIKGGQQVLKFEDKAPPVDACYLPEEVGDSWGLNGDQTKALSAIFYASCAYRSGAYKIAVTMLEDLIPMVLEARDG